MHVRFLKKLDKAVGGMWCACQSALLPAFPMPSCRARRLSTAVSRSFMAVSGGVSREWLRREVGEEVAACVPLELGGDFDLQAWSWEG